jgi:hypothetical protein
MTKRPGHVEVTTEVAYCSFCNRSRNLRREEHHLGGMVRTIVTCETCHRTLSSTMGVAPAQEEAAEEVAAAEAPAAPEPAPAPAEKPEPGARAAVAKATSAKARPAAARSTAAKAKPKTTTPRRSTRSK